MNYLVRLTKQISLDLKKIKRSDGSVNKCVITADFRKFHRLTYRLPNILITEINQTRKENNNYSLYIYI